MLPQPHAAGPSITGGVPAEIKHHVGIVAALFTFIGATLIVVGAVILTDAVDRWWILVPVMLVVFAAATAVFAVITALLRDMGD